jgi:hypothetical protein
MESLRHLVSLALLVVGIIHILPLSGVLGSDRLTSLYGISFTEPNLEILMRHRAMLFGVLGLFLVVAAFHPPLQTAALVGGFISVASFLVLTWLVGGYNAQLLRVVWADIVALVFLLVGGSVHIYIRSRD